MRADIELFLNVTLVFSHILVVLNLLIFLFLHIHVYTYIYTCPTQVFTCINTYTHKLEGVKIEIKLDNIRVKQSCHADVLTIKQKKMNAQIK